VSFHNQADKMNHHHELMKHMSAVASETKASSSMRLIKNQENIEIATS